MVNFLKSLFTSKTHEEENGKNEKKNFEILKYDGIRAQRMGRVDYALKCFESALQIEEDFETMNHLAQLYIQLHRLDDAHELLKQMIEREPEYGDTFIVLTNVCYMQERYDEAIEVATRAVALGTHNALANYLLAKAYVKKTEMDRAIVCLGKAIDEKNDFQEALLLRAECYLDKKAFAQAQSDIDTLLSVADDEENALLLRGRLKLAVGDETMAKEDFRKVTEVNPFCEQAFLCLGDLFILQKTPDKAIEVLDEGIDMNPQSAKLYRARAKARLLNGDKEGADVDGKISLEMENEESTMKTPVVQKQEAGSGVLGGM